KLWIASDPAIQPLRHNLRCALEHRFVRRAVQIVLKTRPKNVELCFDRCSGAPVGNSHDVFLETLVSAPPIPFELDGRIMIAPLLGTRREQLLRPERFEA